MAIASTIERYLMKHQVPYDVMMHPHTETSRETVVAAHIPGDRLAKAILLTDDRGYVMAIVPASRYLQLNTLRRELHRDVRLVEEPEVNRLFDDCASGAIPAMGPAYGIETWVDDSLIGQPEIFFEAGDHELLLRLSMDSYRALLNSAHYGHFSH